jgi:hypothetical protein
LFLSAVTPGGLVNVRPVQPAHSVAVGVVTRSNNAVGSIEVKIQVGEHLEFLHDVLLTSKANGDFLVYESATSLWKNRTLASLDLLTATAAASVYQPLSGMGSYLTTSAAATTYAPIASPTFTGTVTIPAGASISGFAPLASPVFTGVPEAPTAAATTNTTQVATTAFVQQEVPAASTTAAGKVELATDAEAVAGTSATLAVTPAGVKAVAINPNRVHIATAAFTAGTSGVGAGAAQNFNQRQVTAPTSAVGHAVLFYSFVVRNRGGFYNGRIDWSKRNEFAWLISKGVSSVSSSNTIGRVVIGKPSFSSTPGDPSGNAVGIRMTGGGNLELIVHDGTTLTAVSTSRTVSSTFAAEYKIVSDGAGNVTLFENDTQLATTSAGPTGSATGGNSLTVEAQNIDTITGTGMQFVLGNFTADFGY